MGERTLAPRIDVLATGLKYPEGPVWHGPHDVTFVELAGQRVQRWTPAGLTVVATIGGAPNGATLGRDGALYLANNGGLAPSSLETMWFADDGVTGRLQRLTLDGKVEDLAVDLPGPEPHRPNDLRFGPDGSLYYTDPGNWEVFPDRQAYLGGAVCRLDQDGKARVFAPLGEFPNGLAFSPDWRRLFVAQSMNGTVQVFDLADRQPRPSRFCRVPAGAPDGITFDTAGRLYVASSLAADGGDAIFIYGPSGDLETTYHLPAGSDPTNLCLGDDGLYVTLGLGGQLVFIAHPARPAPLLP